MKTGRSQFRLTVTNVDNTIPTVTSVNIYTAGSFSVPTLYNGNSNQTTTTALAAWNSEDGSIIFYSTIQTFDVEVSLTDGRTAWKTSIVDGDDFIFPENLGGRPQTSADASISIVKTLTYTIGVAADTDADFNFADDADSASQDIVIDAGGIPTGMKIINVGVVCQINVSDGDINPSVEPNFEIGVEHSTTDMVAVAECGDVGNTLSSVASLEVTINDTDDIIVDGNPNTGTNWDDLTAGRWAILITVVDMNSVAL